ncbi:MAG: hypothetical protein AB7E85_08085 [Pseudobdellovibrionaceae bacterium]
MARKLQTKSASDDIQNIKEDLTSLTNNVIGIARRLEMRGIDKAALMKDELTEKMAVLKENGRVKYGEFEDGVKSHPTRSVALAFGAGALLSLLMSRRGK